MSIGIGIAGFGRHAVGRILPAIDADPRLHLAAVWTRSEGARVLLHERAVPVTPDFEEFLGVAMDVVYVATPTALHAEHAEAALRAGRHTWVEKPLATRLEDVEHLTDLAAGAGLMLAEAFMFPWHAQAAVVRDALCEGRIGAPRNAALTFCFPHLEPDNFRYDPALGGGAFLDHACYLVKALDTYLGGEWSLLGGCLDHAGRAVDVAGAALLRRAGDGVVANLSWGFGRSYVNEIEIVGEHGRMRIESAFTKPASRSCEVLLEDGRGARLALEVPREDPYGRMLEGYARRLDERETWPGMRREILEHARRYFSLHSRLQRCDLPEGAP